MFKFTGKNTSRSFTYRAEAESPIKLYEELVATGVISTVDGDPYEIAKAEKSGITESNFLDDDGDVDFDEFQKAVDNAPDLTDSEILNLIGEQDGNAYYQSIIMTQGDAAEYLGVSRARISALAKSGKIQIYDGVLDASSVAVYKETRKGAGRPVGTMKIRKKAGE